MVLHRPVEPALLLGHWRLGEFPVSDNLVYQALAGFIPLVKNPNLGVLLDFQRAGPKAVLGVCIAAQPTIPVLRMFC